MRIKEGQLAYKVGYQIRYPLFTIIENFLNTPQIHNQDWILLRKEELISYTQKLIKLVKENEQQKYLKNLRSFSGLSASNQGSADPSGQMSLGENGRLDNS